MYVITDSVLWNAKCFCEFVSGSGSASHAGSVELVDDCFLIRTKERVTLVRSAAAMPPRFAHCDTIDSCRGNVESSSQCCSRPFSNVGFRLEVLNNERHVSIREFCCAHCLSSNWLNKLKTPLLDAVFDVVLHRTGKQVVWTAARRIVAMVTNVFSRPFKVSMAQSECNALCGKRSCLSKYSDITIPVLSYVPLPRPATVSLLFAPRPKTCGIFAKISVVIAKAFNELRPILRLFAHARSIRYSAQVST